MKTEAGPPSSSDLLPLLSTALTTLISLLASLVFFAALRRSRRRRLLLRRLGGRGGDGSPSLPLAPGSSGWLLGHVPSLLSSDFHSLMCLWADQLSRGGKEPGKKKRSAGAYLVALPFGDRGVVVTGPEGVAAVLGGSRCKGGAPGSSLSPPLPKYSPAYGVLDALWGGLPSVFTCPRMTPRWASVRKLALAPAFSVSAARGCVSGIAEAAAELCLSVEEQGREMLRSMGEEKEERRSEKEERRSEKEERRSEKEERWAEADDGGDDPSLVVVSAEGRSPSPPSITVNADALGMRLALAAVGRSTLGLGEDFGAADASRRCAPVAALSVALPEVQASMSNPLRLLSLDSRSRRASRAREEFEREVLGATRRLRERHGEGMSLPRAAAALLSRSQPPPGPAAAAERDDGGRERRPRPSPLNLSDAALAAEVGTLIMGGFETTGHVLAFALLRLAACPRAQARVARELAVAGLLEVPPTPTHATDTAPAPSSRPPPPSCPVPRLPSSSDLRQLPYTLAVAKEALRLHPTVPGVPRTTASEDFVLPLDSGDDSGDDEDDADADGADEEGRGGRARPVQSMPSVLVPAGTFVYPLLRHAQRDESEWGERALEFRPERWEGRARAGEDDDGGGDRGAGERCCRGKRGSFYAPFSLGPRDCAGKTLALVTLHAAIAVVVSRFELVAVPESYEGFVDERSGVGGYEAGGGRSFVDVPEVVALTAHPARPFLKLVPRARVVA